MLPFVSFLKIKDEKRKDNIVCGSMNDGHLHLVKTEIMDLPQALSFLTEDTYGKECGLTTVHIKMLCGKYCTK